MLHSRQLEFFCNSRRGGLVGDRPEKLGRWLDAQPSDEACAFYLAAARHAPVEVFVRVRHGMLLARVKDERVDHGDAMACVEVRT